MCIAKKQKVYTVSTSPVFFFFFFFSFFFLVVHSAFLFFLLCFLSNACSCLDIHIANDSNEKLLVHIVANFIQRKIKTYRYLAVREQWQKTFVTLGRFWPIVKGAQGWGKRGSMNPIKFKKGKIVAKSFFQIMLNEVLKFCEKWYLLM